MSVDPLDAYSGACFRAGVEPKEKCILVDIATQTLRLVENMRCVREYLISSARNGVGQVKDSYQTPCGLHEVVGLYGKGGEPFRVYRNRKSTEQIAVPNGVEDLIVGRILQLGGLQDGVNRGMGESGAVVDSQQRNIYIHGTNQVSAIGRPQSAGCVRMLPADVIELFEWVEMGTHVYIYHA